MTTRRLLTTLLAALALAACGDDPTGPEDETPQSLAGRYLLVSVNGDSLPVVIRDDSVRVTINSGYFNLNTDETFTYAFAYSVTRNGATTPETSNGLGQWFQNNNAVFLGYFDDSFPDGGTVVGRYLYVTVPFASPYVFRRE